MPHQQRRMPTVARFKDQNDSASFMINGHTEGSDKTKRRRFLPLSLCAHRSCFRIFRKDKHQKKVLCHKHEENLKIAVAEMLYDWFTPNTPWGISASSSGGTSASQITMRRRQVLNVPQNRARRSQHPSLYQNQQQPGRMKKQTAYNMSPSLASFTQRFPRLDEYNSD